ncbi:MAG: ankyrin repeat domain-containing protein [Gammaproteobacteria bacterium]
MRLVLLAILVFLGPPALAASPLCGVVPADNSSVSIKLMRAAISGDINGMWRWIGECANPNYQDKDGVPILGAVFKAKPKNMRAVVNVLVNVGADVNARTYILPISFSLVGSSDCDPKVLDILFKHGLIPNDTEPVDGSSTLDAAIFLGGNIACIDALIAHNAMVNFTNRSGETPLLDAVYRKDSDIVSLLLENGARPNISNDIGITPLMAAAAMKSTDIVKSLMKNGANPCLRNEDGKTASDTAEEAGDDKLAQLLVCDRKSKHKSK